MDAIGDGDEQTLQAILGRSGFVGGIDNEALDFSQLEEFINSNNEQPITYFADTLVHNETNSSANHSIQTEMTASMQQLSQKLPSPLNNPITTTCSSIRTTGSAYKDQQSYTLPHGIPDSPPDSSSEPPYSPPGHHEACHIHSPHIDQKNNLPAELLLQQHQDGSGNHASTLMPTLPRGSSRSQDSLLLSHPVLTPLLTMDTPINIMQQQQQLLTTLLPLPHEQQNPNGIATLCTSLHPASKKLKHNQDGLLHVKQEPELGTIDHSFNSSGTGLDNDEVNSDNNHSDITYQCIRFHPFQQISWHSLCDHNLKELPVPRYRVDADKGFNFSNSDDAFVCQKKNHFQITCHAQLQGEAIFVKTIEGLKKINSFQLHFYGVKVESQTQTIKVEQSQSDRTKKPFHPVVVEMGGQRVTKVTVGRLHFSETTSNNMRKKGKPNPDQRYFYLVVGLHAHTSDQANYQVVAHASERIIVRASNPGQFESDGSTLNSESTWQKGIVSDSIYYAGRVGINTDRPDEALVIHGNVKVTGHIVQPSDARAKQNIYELDTRDQLKNVQQLRIVRYRYAPEFAQFSGLGIKTHEDTGVIAQEVQQILPEAVLAAGDIVLSNGQKIDNFLVVNKERIFMENIGAVKELCKVTDSLESRIDQLERINKRLVKLKREDSLKSSISSVSHIPNLKNLSINAITSVRNKSKKYKINEEVLCSNKFIQIIIVILILIMAFCLAAMASLYFLEYQKYNSMEWTSIVSNSILTVGPSHTNTLQTSISQDFKLKPMLQSTQATYTKFGVHLSTILNHKSRKNNFFSTQLPSAKRHLYSQEINWNLKEHPGMSTKTNSNNFPSNRLNKNISGGVRSNNEENNQTSDVDTPSITKLSMALGKPAECSIDFMEFENPCQIYCCTTDIQHDQLTEKKSIYHLEQPLTIHEEKRKLNKGLQNGISLSDSSIQTLIKENNYKYLHKRNGQNTRSDNNWGEVTSNAASFLLPEYKLQLYIYSKTFNTSLDQRYCSAPTLNTPNNFSCIIPLSKYMSDTHITLRFIGMTWYWQVVQQCTSFVDLGLDENMSCSWNYPNNANQAQFMETTNQPGDQSFNLDVAYYVRKSLIFRVPTIQSQYNICKEKQRGEFIEFMLHFYRDCDE